MASSFFSDPLSSLLSKTESLAPTSPAFESLDSEQDRARRARLIAELVLDRDLQSEAVRDAMLRVPRHLFVNKPGGWEAYENTALPIGYGQTISQPAVVAMMTEALDLTGNERVLEIGTGSGYQAAILSHLAREVFTIERVAPLGDAARELLAQLGYKNVHVRVGDGYQGWPEKAPFDRIIATAAPPEIPGALITQLVDGGVLVAPVGDTMGYGQMLVRVRKSGGHITMENLCAVRFVPMVEGEEKKKGMWN
ncbi:MAG: protein-L-isoaspartate(D-aspartate) O-methyltransferase [Polyangiaceae bacterium]|nr:protein-L-isoaspartate(D-aspartate) O-methyltransferase [Polyangiaceae bacterium]NUQ73651.1 protein-L-isoaspartate(D-aspartate) O-methyltransferase [Polyangiaceae bacterium]